MRQVKDNCSRLADLHVLLIIAVLAVLPGLAQAQDDLGRRPLTHDDYDKWNSIGQQIISEDGAWVAFSIRSADDAATLTIREVETQREYAVANGSRAQFSYDGKYAAYVINPDPDLVKSLREKDTSSEDMPTPKLEILELSSSRHVTIPDVRSFSFPDKGSGWISYSMARPADKTTVTEHESEIRERYAIEASGLRATSAPMKTTSSSGEQGSMVASEEEEEVESEPPGDKENGVVLVLRSLETGIERRFPDVASHRFSKFGKLLVFAASAADAEDDGVFVVNLENGSLMQIISGRGRYQSIAISEDEDHVAFLSDRDDFGPVKPSLSLYEWDSSDESAKKIAGEGSEGVPEGWWIASTQPVFTEDGRRLLFNTQPKPDDAGKTKEEIEKEKKEKERDPDAVLDVWHWKDLELQPQQLVQADRERRRSYRALYDMTTNAIVQLATKDMPDVSIDVRSGSDVAVGTSDLKYALSRSWESPSFRDSYLVDLKTGEATLVLEKVRASASLSPEGDYISWWDPEVRKYFAMSTSDHETVDTTEGIPASLANELHDTPAPPRSYGTAGWLDDDEALLLYDRFDIWKIDPTGQDTAVCLTGEQGRANRVRYRYVRLDSEQRSIGPEEEIVLSAFNEATKSSGYSTLNLGNGQVTSLLMLDESVGGLRKARQGNTVLLSRQTFRRYPDLWASTTAFHQMSRLSWANAQQRDYLWGTAELIHYQAGDGQPLDGLLYKPDNFDPSEKYPMLVYFYERSSDGLHRYRAPSAGGSSINFSFYVSRGYVLFVPDIPYDTGHPGQSAANAVLPGIQAVIDLGFVDEERIGVQGHSWGGYQIAYLVTMTNMFACAEAGAPVSNMTSAYGGIRWASGMSRMFQYEKTQSRIGDTLWNARDLYIENSPVFHADRIETPLLMLHNDEDGAVPWYQGIELFVALRRLEKPVWLLNYNGEAHGLRRKENREDFARRMQQFFDHHLLDAPASMWIAEGIRAIDKGKDFGFDPVETESEVEEQAEQTDQQPSTM